MKESLEENKIALGVAFGVVFGIILGAVIDNVGLGIALGIALGAALGSTIHKEYSSSEEKWKNSIPSSPAQRGFLFVGWWVYLFNKNAKKVFHFIAMEWYQ